MLDVFIDTQYMDTIIINNEMPISIILRKESWMVNQLIQLVVQYN